jgi:hypothetical protein
MVYVISVQHDLSVVLWVWPTMHVYQCVHQADELLPDFALVDRLVALHHTLYDARKVSDIAILHLYACFASTFVNEMVDHFYDPWPVSELVEQAELLVVKRWIHQEAFLEKEPVERVVFDL